MAKAVEVFGGSDSGDGKVALDVFDLGVGMPEKIVEQGSRRVRAKRIRLRESEGLC